ncbi:uncharacterized protein LOC135089662 isoform X2 [Scylla paramamosain]|uniref:uncharacterized protein LOC135089662 isoform X2 n=1 Tax=Scylla paramamosain TaxID=85552 RepID=UPI0030828D59
MVTMQRWHAVSLALVVAASWTVTAVTVDPTISPEMTRNATADDPLTVQSQSKYCDWDRALGPVCVYNTTTQVVVVPEGLSFTSGQLELEIHNASVVNLYPTCVSWIQIYHTGMIHTFPSERRFECRTWLRIYSSKVGRVEHGVKDLTLQDSEVDTIKLINQRDFMAINSTINEIEQLDWGGYRSTVLNTTIKRLAGVEARDSWYVVGGRFGAVASGGIVFNAKEMSVINSTINHMSSKALTIKSGTVSFANVTISYLEAMAITLASPTASLSLSNVTIRAANAPCFVILDRERIKLENVTVFSIPTNENSSFFQFLDDDLGGEKNASKSTIKDLGRKCSFNETTVSCDHAGLEEDVLIEIVGEDIHDFKQVHISNVSSLLVTSTGCQTDLRLENVHATLPHLTALPRENEEGCNVTVSAKNSSLNVVWAKNINNFNAVSSTVKRIHGGSLDSFTLTKSSVQEIDEVEVAGSGAVWSKAVFLVSISITLKAPLISSVINFSHIHHMGENSFIIDHPGKTSKLDAWMLGWMERHSIVVKNGSHVELSNMVAVSVAEEAIYLEEGATATCRNIRILQSPVYIFSVASRSQVELQGDLLAGLSTPLIYVRSPPVSVNKQSPFTVSDSHISAYCRTIPYYLQICDFSSAPREEVTVDFANSQVSNRVIIKGASSVMLFPSCVEKVILMNVKTASTTRNERECGTWLEALGVHLTNVTSGVHDVTLKACTVELLAPDRRLRDVDLEETTVERVVGVHWAGYTGVFNSSRLGEVRSLRADSRLMMSNSKVETLVAGGMFLAAEAIIVNTTFKEIHTAGMTVNGSTRMQDVTIEKLQRGGIKVLDGLLLLVNVNILETEEESITAEANGGISFQNVTVGGKKVHWRGYLTQANYSKQSVVFLNRHFNETKSKDTSGTPQSRGTTDTIPGTPRSRGPTTTTTTAATTTEHGRSSPKASSMIQWRTTSGEAEVKSSVAPDALASPAIASSWKWAGAGIGFCMGLLVGCCIFIVVKVVKPNKGMLTMPTVFWRVKDDQHELLQEDQGVDESAGARRDQGYSALPRSDIQ